MSKFNLPHPDNCVKCNGLAKESMGAFNLSGSEDGRIYQRTTDAILTPCLKCSDCGHSWIEPTALSIARSTRNTLNQIYNRLNPTTTMLNNPKEEQPTEAPQSTNQPTVWGNSTVSFDINNPDNTDKLSTLAEAGF